MPEGRPMNVRGMKYQNSNKAIVIVCMTIFQSQMELNQLNLFITIHISHTPLYNCVMIPMVPNNIINNSFNFIVI